MVVKTRIGFAASSMTLAADSYMRTGPKGLESYKHGDMRRLVEAGHGTKRGITDAIVLSPAERIDNETVITFATNPYRQTSKTIIWSKPMIIRHTDSDTVSGI
jgi:hypothetical protein